MGSALLLCVLLSALHALWTPAVWSQGLPERNALCGEDGCFVVYFLRKTFLEAWRSCKEKGGNLATMKRPGEARQVEELLAGAERRGSRAKVRVWIGLQRQPRQCSATRPLRGFSWTTGDQDTQYTNWLREDSPSTCSAPRCVVTTHSTASYEVQDNYKWLDGSCSLPVDGFLCRFVYEKGMCQPIPGEVGAGPVMYNTPFHLLSARLTHIPFGSMATVSCLDGVMGDQSVLCLSKEDGTAGWHQDGPFCTDSPPKSWCQEDNGGCQHLCIEANDHYYCECPQGFRLAEDRHNCIPLNPCQDAPCEHGCVPLTEGYRCTCQDGYQLAPDRIRCLDKDECQDVLCEQSCENSLGSYRCHCHLGFFPLPEDPTRCQDVDECQFQDSCEQMCVNYIGGFQCHCLEGYELQPDYSSCRAIPKANESPTAAPSFPWVTSLPENAGIPQVPNFSDQLPQPPEGDWLMETIPEDWLTDLPHLEGLPTDLAWPTDVPVESEREPVEKGEQGEWERKEGQDPEDEHDRLQEHYRPQEPNRPEVEGREDEHDRPRKPYRPEVEDTEDEHERPQEPYRPVLEEGEDEHDRPQEPYRPVLEEGEDEHDRLQEPYRPAAEDREHDHKRPLKPYRPVLEGGEDEHDRPQEPYRPAAEDREHDHERPLNPYRPVLEGGEDEHDRPQEPYRPAAEDKEHDHERPLNPYRPVLEGGEDEHDRPQEPYRPAAEDREHDHERPLKPYRPVLEGGEDEHDRPQEPYRPAAEDREHDHERPLKPYRPEVEDGEDENDRPQEPYRPVVEDTDDEHDRLQEQYRPEEEVRQEDREVQPEPEESNWSNDKGLQSWVSLDLQALTASPSVTSTPDLYEDEDIPHPTAPPTHPPEEDLGYAQAEITEQLDTPVPSSNEFGNREAAPWWDPTSVPQVERGVIFNGTLVDGDEANPLTPEPSTEGPPERDSSKQQGNMWLLIALLVPLCIFLVVMVVLGIVYCTRARARNKNNKDCYHWISGASDKAGAPGAAKV